MSKCHCRYCERSIKTKEEARQHAIDWQSWQSKRAMSYLEAAEWAAYFEKLGRRFGLLREYRENGII